jgi:hypothetical protein
MRRYGYGDGSGSSNAGTGVNSALAAAGVLAKTVVSAEELLVASSSNSDVEAVVAGAASMLGRPVDFDSDDADAYSRLAVLLGFLNPALEVEFFEPDAAFARVPLEGFGKDGAVLLLLFLGPRLLSPLFLLPLFSLLLGLAVGVAV